MFPSHLSLPDDATPQAAIAWEAVEPTIRALAAALALPAQRHPETLAPADVVGPVRRALKRMRPITDVLGVPPLAPLHGAPTLLGLHTRLAAALAHLRVFKQHFWLGHLDEKTFVGWAVGQPFVPNISARQVRFSEERLRNMVEMHAAALAEEAKASKPPKRRRTAADDASAAPEAGGELEPDFNDDAEA